LRSGWDIEAVEYVEKGSSVKHRPIFERMLNDARQRRRFDIVLVWKIDRSGIPKEFSSPTTFTNCCMLRAKRSITQNISSDQNDLWRPARMTQ
jgi:DNA invertase Pin-like site-specific DNA recombinase